VTIMKNSGRINKIVDRLRSNKESTREEASHELMEISKGGLSLEKSLQALKAAAQSFPARRYDFQDSSSELIYAVIRNPIGLLTCNSSFTVDVVG